GSDVARMLRDSAERRDGRTTLPVSLREPDGVREVAAWVLGQEERWRAGTLVSEDPGPPAPHGPHGHDDSTHAHDGGHAHAHVHAH
ncbi:MAG TPA: hypothetical protein VLK58_13755, partial [Conexibacter sp.]|nr:hypothetical protein [Conexibacter sp.]